MRRMLFALGAAVVILLVADHDSQAQRGGRGGGGRVGGGGAVARPSGGAIGGARVGGAAVGPYGGAGAGSRATGTVVGPAGGSRTVTGGSGSYTTGRGTTIEAGGIGRTTTGPGGVTTGRGVGGVQVTTPGGKTVTKVGSGAGAVGPGGVAVGGSRGVTAASGPYGAAAAGSRTVAGRTGSGTYYASRGALATTGGTVRTNFGYYNSFNSGWYAKYPGAWFAAGWTAARIWSAPAWGTVSSYCSYPEEPAYYDYGESVVYSGDNVVINGETEVPAETYAQQATDLATAGKAPKDEPKPDDFQLLGVFAMVQEGDEKSTNIFQLAVSKDGLIRGNYYNALTDTTETVYGSVDKKTQRAAWTVADRKTPVYEAGIANLTKDETTMLVHYSKDNRQQYMLVRIQQPEGEQPANDKQP